MQTENATLTHGYIVLTIILTSGTLIPCSRNNKKKRISCSRKFNNTLYNIEIQELINDRNAKK